MGFQPWAAENRLTKCAYQHGGAAFRKYYGGCGTGGVDKCSDKYSAYNNKCPPDGDADPVTKYADHDCPAVIKGTCAFERKDTHPDICSWRGPAWYSPTHKGATPNMTGIAESDMNELREVMLQRVSSQSSKTLDGSADGITLKEYWSEVVMDARVFKAMEAEDPFSVIAGFGYVKGNKQARDAAQQYDKHYGSKFAIVSIDTAVNVAESGPFGLDEWASAFVENLDDDGAGGKLWKKCGPGDSCCDPLIRPRQLCEEGLECQDCGAASCRCPSKAIFDKFSRRRAAL